MLRLLLIVALLLGASSASAYVGPGLGLGVIGVIFGAILAVILAFLGILWYPIKRLLKRGKSDDGENEVSKPDDEA